MYNHCRLNPPKSLDIFGMRRIMNGPSNGTDSDPTPITIDRLAMYFGRVRSLLTN